MNAKKDEKTENAISYYINIGKGEKIKNPKSLTINNIDLTVLE